MARASTGIALPDSNQSSDRAPAAGPWGARSSVPRHPPPKQLASPVPNPPRVAVRGGQHRLSVAIFSLIILGIGIRAYRDLSRPEAWAYWKELYFQPSLTSSLVAKADIGG